MYCFFLPTSSIYHSIIIIITYITIVTMLQSIKAHSLFEVEDKGAEDCIITARKHLFLANNLHSVLSHVKEMLNENGSSSSGGGNNTSSGKDDNNNSSSNKASSSVMSSPPSSQAVRVCFLHSINNFIVTREYHLYILLSLLLYYM